MRLVVTGGAGFIGSNYVRRALSGHLGGVEVESLTVIDKLTYAGVRENLDSVKDDERFRFVLGDVCDRAMLDEVLPGHDAVVHFAAESHVDRSIAGADAFVTTNVLGTQTLLAGTRHAGIETFVHVSTDEVYGSIDEGAWDESQPLAPNSPYAASKAGSDLLALAYHRTFGLDVRVTRCSNNYGPFQFPEKVVPLFITNLVDGLSVPLYGDGLNVREWIHVDDHCRGVHLALSVGSAGEVYNLGGGTELTNRELTARLLAAMGVGWERVEPVADRLGHDRRYALDGSKARETLGYEPHVDFAEGLKDTIEWYRTHEEWWRPLQSRRP